MNVSKVNPLTLHTTYIPHLRTQFQVAAPVLFLGAGFSSGAKTRNGWNVPSTSELTETLWTLCFPSDDFDDTTQLQDIFETARARYRNKLIGILRDSFSVDVESCLDWHESCLSMPWSRIYTLNLDDLVENVLSTTRPSRPIKTVSATTGENVPDEDSNLSVIHLNGFLDDIPDDVTFSRSQYARRPGMHDYAYNTLIADLQFRPVVFIGSELDEPPLWSHLELRGDKLSGRELRPRSYLVTPVLNASKETLLAKHNIVHLPYTALEFSAEVLSELEEARRVGTDLLRTRALSPQRDADTFLTVSQLAQNPLPSQEYLLGAEPTWDDVNSGRIANRTCFDELWEQISAIRQKPDGSKFLLVTGTAGTGKTSALMMTATQLQADGLRVAWLDQDSTFSPRGFRAAVSRKPQVDAIFINDADMYGRTFSRLVSDALSANKRLIIVAEVRNSKLEDIVDPGELRQTQCVEYRIPVLTDGDISAVLDVLDREQRLGLLRDKTRAERQAVFRSLAGRQMLVAMHMATHGKDHRTKAIEELRQLSRARQYIYGLVCVATARRLTLTKDDIAIAAGSGDPGWLQELDQLVRSKLLHQRRRNGLRARHRVIAQFVYNSLEEGGELAEVIRGLVMIGASKTSANTPRSSLYYRLLQIFLNHNLLINSIGLEKSREIYSEFQSGLGWNHHYWLHRGAIELESGNLELAENFLGQAKGLGPNDIMVDNELAYLMLKQANAHPTAEESAQLVDDAIETLLRTARARPDLAVGHCYHIIGREGLRWSQFGINSHERRIDFLGRIRRIVSDGYRLHPTEMIKEINEAVQRAYLQLAVESGPQPAESNETPVST